MVRTLILALLISTLAACGMSAPAKAPPDDVAHEAGGTPRQPRERAVPSPTSEVGPEATERDLAEEASTMAPRASDPTPSQVGEEVEVEQSRAIDPFWGQPTVKEKVAFSDVIVRATMTTVSADIGTDNIVFLKFNLKVSEYLMGTGPSSIVAVWIDSALVDTRPEAEARKAALLAGRDAQWDDREAVIFLIDEVIDHYGPTVTELLGRDDHFFLGYGNPQVDDYYSLHSKSGRYWLPSAGEDSSPGVSSIDDDRAYLLDVPTKSEGSEAQGTTPQTPTVTLAELKTAVRQIAAEIDAGDGSEAFRKCIRAKYSLEGRERQRESEGKELARKSPSQTNLVSGRPIGTVLHERTSSGIYPNRKSKTWFEGADAALLAVTQGDGTPYDIDGDDKFTADIDGIKFTEKLTTMRPLPAGEYSVVRKEVWATFLDCNYVLDSEWTITVTAPSGTLHEMFFDPVTVGTAVAADATNGVLDPRAFTGASGAAATIGRIAYEPAAAGSAKSAQVTIEVTPAGALSGQVVDFIGLDGTVSLALSVAKAAVDTANYTLSWPVASQPWNSGDKLMVRVRAEPELTPAP